MTDGAAAWQRAEPPLSTPWTAQVSPENALVDYPRPQLTRRRWLSLNGVWEFAEASRKADPPFGTRLSERILVPYPVESALSGIMRRVERMFYRRTVVVPTGWRGSRVLLHFGAVDFATTVWVNGVEVAQHRGGYTAFSADMTDALRPDGEQEIVVWVRDPTGSGGQAVGKQRRRPRRIWYTPVSGIWQTVWLEPVPAAHVAAVVATPDLATSSVGFDVRVDGAVATGDPVTVDVFAGRTRVGSATAPAGEPLRVTVPAPRLWSPEDPYLYRVRVQVGEDVAHSYFGMRSVGIGKDADGTPRLLLNGTRYFPLAPLDQGYWPDGLYTAPTDEAMRFDLEQQKRLGFNSTRKHVKVEPARWFFWADRIGLLVWQDMPSPRIGSHDGAARQQFLRELREMVEQHRGDTCVICWVPFNEGWGEFEPARAARIVKRLDPTRLVDADSGVNCCYSLPDGGEGDVYDDHTYVGPGAALRQERRIAIAGEYGGLGVATPGHDWPGTPYAYEMQPDRDALTTRYEQVQQRLRRLAVDDGVAGGIYTQATDVENEVNGLWTYDRRVEKFDADRVRAANLAVIAAGTAAGG